MNKLGLKPLAFLVLLMLNTHLFTCMTSTIASQEINDKYKDIIKENEVDSKIPLSQGSNGADDKFTCN